MSNQFLGDPVLFLAIALNQQSSHKQSLSRTAEGLPHLRQSFWSRLVANFANCAFTIPFRHLRQRVCPLSWSSKDRGAPHTHIPWDSNCLRLFFWYSSFFWLLLSILSFTNYRIANLKKGVKRAFIPPLKGWVFSPAIL